MAVPKSTVKLTANFEANLAAIRAFLDEAGAPQGFGSLLDDLLETAVPNLERFPRLGRPFLERDARSAESRAVVDRMRSRIGGGEIREIVFGEYVVLYALIENGLYLLSIRHHRQLSFDFGRFWKE